VITPLVADQEMEHPSLQKQTSEDEGQDRIGGLTSHDGSGTFVAQGAVINALL
jgi:hypothetical protein